MNPEVVTIGLGYIGLPTSALIASHGTNEDLIVSKALDLLNNQDNFMKMSKLHNPYGEGLASKRIVDFIKNIE